MLSDFKDEVCNYGPPLFVMVNPESSWDNPEIVNNLQALFNQDNGTGRTVQISGHGFTEAYRFIGDWLQSFF